MVLDPEGYAALREVLGTKRALSWAQVFLGDLARAFPPDSPPDRVKLFERAHRLGGRAGLVGCLDLVEACQTLQHACRTDADLTVAYCAARSAAKTAMQALRRVLLEP